MANIACRTTDGKREQFHEIAKEKGLSVNRLLDEWAMIAITERNTFARFSQIKKQGDQEKALEILKSKAEI